MREYRIVKVWTDRGDRYIIESKADLYPIKKKGWEQVQTAMGTVSYYSLADAKSQVNIYIEGKKPNKYYYPPHFNREFDK